MTNTILKTLILASFVGVILSCLATVKTYPYELDCNVSIDHDNVEIDFVPTHSLYKRRCIREDAFVYCASLDSLTTVSIDHDDVEIDFIADAQ